jgi:hypothetical protein
LRLSEIRASQGATTLFEEEYLFNGAGQLLLQQGSDQRTFGYDGLGRLTIATGPWELPYGVPQAVGWGFVKERPVSRGWETPTFTTSLVDLLSPSSSFL